MFITVNGSRIDLSRYSSFHALRYQYTLDLVRSLNGGRTIELGGHPWSMTSLLLSEFSVDLLATISAEEVTAWTEEVPVSSNPYRIELPDGSSHEWINISANSSVLLSMIVLTLILFQKQILFWRVKLLSILRVVPISCS